MYTPKLNLLTDQQEAMSFMQRFSFATIVTVKDGIPSATHLPFIVSQRDGKIILTSHFAKVNPQATEILGCKPLVIFSEPHAYISPRHYESEQNVPTWNYMAVHAYGAASIIDSPDAKAQLLEQTIKFYEADYLRQWDALPREYRHKMMNGITGFEIVIDELQSKKKLSQNRSEKEKESIIAELGKSNVSSEKDIADYMQKQK
jgi:transcriptional regulator